MNLVLLFQQPSVNADVEERLRRLEADKDSLQLQVAVLTEQIDVQTDKISDLEKLLDEKKSQLASAEDVLQRVSEKKKLFEYEVRGGEWLQPQQDHSFFMNKWEHPNSSRICQCIAT
jgi:chromosome segregation ATPase